MMGGSLKNYTGLTFSHLTAIEFFGRKNNKTFWKFQCECRQIVIKSIDSVKYGNTKSCGCLNSIKRNIDSENTMSFTNLYHRYKTSAKTRKIEFKLSKDEFRKITSSNCFYCGIEPLQIGRQVIKSKIYLYNGIDRLNNSIGYNIENSKPCCFVCNRAKRDMSFNEFLNYIDRLKNHKITT